MLVMVDTWVKAARPLLQIAPRLVGSGMQTQTVPEWRVWDESSTGNLGQLHRAGAIELRLKGSYQAEKVVEKEGK